MFPYKLVDLTHPLEPAIATWSGSCGFNHNLQLDYADCNGPDKFRIMEIKMDAGIGTHMDAPSHAVCGGRSIHQFTVQELCMSCVIIDVVHKCHERYTVNLDDVAAFEREFGTIAKDSCVMIKTGWSKYWDKPEKYNNNHVFPSVSLEVANLLLQRSVSALGIDTLSPDRPEDGFNVHRAFLGAGKILIENMANLDKMPPMDAHVMVLPLKVKDGTEAPVRLVGLLSFS
ncbi:MAG: hypothetical protein RLZ12_268 [Bacillota bacterium]